MNDGRFFCPARSLFVLAACCSSNCISLPAVLKLLSLCCTRSKLMLPFSRLSMSQGAGLLHTECCSNDEGSDPPLSSLLRNCALLHAQHPRKMCIRHLSQGLIVPIDRFQCLLLHGAISAGQHEKEPHHPLGAFLYPDDDVSLMPERYAIDEDHALASQSDKPLHRGCLPFSAPHRQHRRHRAGSVSHPCCLHLRS